MTQANPFLDILSRAKTAPDNRKAALDVLEQFRQAIEMYWSTQLTCKVVLGYPTNFGQEYRVVISAQRTGSEYTLLRAYIPLFGQPIKLDLYNFQMVDCGDAAAMKNALEAFLDKPEVRSAIDTYATN
jgi:hypothetical protein